MVLGGITLALGLRTPAGTRVWLLDDAQAGPRGIAIIEFALILPNTPKSGAMTFARAIRRLLAKLALFGAMLGLAAINRWRLTPAPVASSAPMPTTAVILANLGTPDGHDYWSMRRYLNEFLSDKRVVDTPDWKWQPILQGIILMRRPFTSGANYRSIWNHEADESPLLTLTKAQVGKLADACAARWGDRVMVDFCMRYGNPSTPAVLDRMVRAGCDRIVFLPLYPQYAGATAATANDQLFRALMAQKWQPAVRTCPAYFDRPDYIDALAQSVERTLGGRRPQKLVASYHGMPRRYLLEGDPYHCQCQKTTRLLRERLGWPEDAIDTTFQSVFGREEWLKPYTVEHVADLAGSLSAAGHDVNVATDPATRARFDLPGDAMLTVGEVRALGRGADVVHAHGFRAGLVALGTVSAAYAAITATALVVPMSRTGRSHRGACGSSQMKSAAKTGAFWVTARTTPPPCRPWPMHANAWPRRPATVR